MGLIILTFGNMPCFGTICIYFSKVKLQTNIHPYAQRFTLHSLHDCFFAGSIQPEKMSKKIFKVAPQPTQDSGHTPDPLADLPESSYLCQNRYRILYPYKVQDFFCIRSILFSLCFHSCSQKKKKHSRKTS